MIDVANHNNPELDIGAGFVKDFLDSLQKAVK
jgi:hypothetical protein